MRHDNRPAKHVWMCLAVAAALLAQPSPGVRARELGAQAMKDVEQPDKRVRARDMFEEALALARQEHDSPLEAWLLEGLARADSGLGNPLRAADSLRVALAIREKLPDRAEEAYTADRLASVLAALAEKREALALQKRALGIRRSLGDTRGQAQTLTNIGLNYAAMGEHQDALDHYALALPLWRNLGEAHGHAVALHNMAETHIFLGDWETATGFCNQALALHRAAEDWPGYVHTLIHLGEASAGQGQTARGIGFQQQALAISREKSLPWMEVTALLELGDSLRRSGRATEARTHLQAALDTIRARQQRQREAAAVLGLAEIDGSVELFERALALSREFENRQVELPARIGLGRVASARGDWRAAQRHLEAAVALIEGTRAEVRSAHLRATFLAIQREAFELLIGAYLQQGRLADAFGASEKAHARTLLELMAQARAGGAVVAPIGLDAARASLEPGEAMLHYFAGLRASYVFALTRGGAAAYKLPPSARIESIVRRLRDLVAVPGRRQASQLALAAREAGEAMLGPALGSLVGQARLTLVPDGPVHYAPMAAMMVDGKALVERFELGVAASASILAAQRSSRARGATTGWLGFGDPAPLPPNPSGAPWARLATGAREVADIARLFPAGEATALVGNAATEVAAKRGRGARYLHFAVHGWIDDRRPERSGLVLAPSQGEDGMLRVAEIAALRVPARLAVLAACDTGLGPELRGEGVLGLTRAFLNAGLEQVVVTLWPVSDQSTGRLMPQFYKELLGGARAGAALRSAQLAMLADPATSHPYHWASFVVNGDSPRR